jgi:hypothetical protein
MENVGQYYSCWRYRNQLGRLKTFQNKLKIATSHKGILDLKLENVQTGKSIEEINNGIEVNFISFILYRTSSQPKSLECN